MTTTSSALKRKHGDMDKCNCSTIISIHGVPTSVNFSLLTNALGLYISQAFCWSIKFVDASFSSECIEMYTYDNKLVGRLRLRPRRSHYSRSSFNSYSIVHAESTGTLELFGRGKSNEYYSSTTASVLNDLVAKQPMLVTGFDGKVVKARSLLFEADDDPFFTGGSTWPRAKESARRASITNNFPIAKLAKTNKNSFVSMLSTAAGVGSVHGSFHDPGNATARTDRAPKLKVPQIDKENSCISMHATNGGDNFTKPKLSLRGTMFRKNGTENSTIQKLSSNEPKAPLGNINEDREYWQGRIRSATPSNIRRRKHVEGGE